MTTQIIEYSKTEAALAELRGRYEGQTYDLSTTAGDKAARAARAEVKGYRVALEKMRTELKAPALERSRLIDAEAKRITLELLALEAPIDEQIKQAEQAVAEAKAEKARIEAERVASIQSKVADIRAIPNKYVGAWSPEIVDAIAATESIEVSLDEFAEFAGEAMQAKAQTISALNDLLEKSKAQEAEQAKLAAERAELDKLRAEQAAREMAAAAEQAEAERKAQAERDAYVQQQRIEQGKREAEQRRIAEEQAAAQAEIDRQRRELAEQQKAAARAEAERLELIAQQQRDAEAAEQQRLEAIDREKQEKMEVKAAEKRAKDERKAREQFMQNGPDPKEIIALIAAHYDVPENIAINWLARHEFSDLLAA